jgi:hypothetical protein
LYGRSGAEADAAKLVLGTIVSNRPEAADRSFSQERLFDIGVKRYLQTYEP